MKYKTMKTKACTIALAAAVAAQFCAAEAPKVREALFPLTDVHLTGGPLKAQQEQNRQYLLRLDPDRLLSRFRSEAGLKPKAPPYGGWESSKVKSVDLAEHILAFWMAGAAATVEATGDEELKRRLLYVIDELAAVQDAHGCGYALATENGRKAMAQIAEGALPADALRRPADYLEPTAVGPLTFRLKDTEVLLVPMFALHYSRYAMYWRRERAKSRSGSRRRRATSQAASSGSGW